MQFKLGEILAILGVLILIVSGIFYTGFKYGTNKEHLAGDKRVEAQKSADLISFNSSNQSGAKIGENFQNIVNTGNSDYDSFVQRNTECATGTSVSKTGLGTDESTAIAIVLPPGSSLINTYGYAKLLKDVEFQRGQVIGLQECVRDPKGCKYP